MIARDGYIYLIQQEGTNTYKIGSTQDSDMKKRLSNLQVGNPEPLIFVGSFYTYAMKHVEIGLHNFFDAQHYRGEWYHLTPHDVTNMLQSEWRKEHGFFGHEEEFIFDALYTDWQDIASTMERFMSHMRHFSHLRSSNYSE